MHVRTHLKQSLVIIPLVHDVEHYVWVQMQLCYKQCVCSLQV